MTNEERYLKLRDLMSRNLPTTWEKVEELGAIGAYTTGSEFDAYLDSIDVNWEAGKPQPTNSRT